MAVDYRILRDEGLLEVRLPPRTTLADLRAYVVATLADPGYSPSLVEVVDVTALTDPADAAMAFDAGRLLVRVAPLNRVRARAIVAPTALLGELAHTLRRETHAAGSVETRVFRTVGAARRWARRIARRTAGTPPPS